MGEFEKRMRDLWESPFFLKDVLKLIKEARKEFYQIEQKASEKTTEDIDNGLSGGQAFHILFLKNSISLVEQFRNKWFGVG